MNNKPQQQQQQQHNNSNNIFDLTLRLSQALDQNYDVVHMDAVISVISALEGTTITKEQLEATRLAKFINQLRRRTKSEQLARRAKSLLKKWREMVGMQQQQQFVNDMTNTAVLNVNANLHLQQQHNMVSISVSSRTEILQTNVLSNRSAATATLTSSSLTKSANSNVYNNCNKRLEILPEGPSGSAAASTVALPIATDASTNTGKKQPQQQTPLTSFTNLIKGLHNNNNRNVSNKSQNILLNNITPMSASALALTAQHNREINNSTESFIIDQTSNSNSALSLPTTLKSKTTKTTKKIFVAAPIIIDIQDSNSGSNIIAPTNLSAVAKNFNNDATTLATAPPLNSSMSTTAIPFLKTKKAKKEKKRRETTQNEMLTTMSHSDASSVVVIGEEGSLSSNQQLRRVDNGREKFQNALGNHKSQRSYPGPPLMSGNTMQQSQKYLLK